MGTAITTQIVAMADTRTVVAHLVTAEAVAAGHDAERDVWVCETVVLPGSLEEDTNRYFTHAGQVRYPELNGSGVWEDRHGDR